LLAVRGPAPRLQLAAALWPDLADERACGNLRTVLWRLRQDGPGLVDDQADMVGLGSVRLDLAEVKEWAWRAIRGEEPWVVPPGAATRELLPGWGEVWLVGPREELRLLQLQALETSTRRLLEAGRIPEAAGLAAAALGLDPVRESTNRLLIEIDLRQGNKVEALRHYRRFERLLRQEVDVTPDPALVALLPAVRTAPRASRRPKRLTGRPAGGSRAARYRAEDPTETQPPR
jgi:DNA-binding SARP family transcriptional activator